MSYLGLIPARAGSKRIPKKNIKDFGGKPLIYYSIEYAKKIEQLSKIVVSTDSEEIGEIATKYGVEVIYRPAELAADNSPSVLAVKHCFDVLQDRGENYDNVVLLQPSQPMRPKSLVNDAIHQFEKGNYDSLMTATNFKKKIGKINDGEFIPVNFVHGQRSQDMEPLYYENGLLFITKKELVYQDKMVGDNNYTFVVDDICAHIDLDEILDFEIAEFLFLHKKYLFESV